MGKRNPKFIILSVFWSKVVEKLILDTKNSAPIQTKTLFRIHEGNFTHYNSDSFVRGHSCLDYDQCWTFGVWIVSQILLTCTLQLQHYCYISIWYFCLSVDTCVRIWFCNDHQQIFTTQRPVNIAGVTCGLPVGDKCRVFHYGNISMWLYTQIPWDYANYW